MTTGWLLDLLTFAQQPAAAPAAAVATASSVPATEVWKARIEQVLASMSDPVAFLVLAVAVLALSWGWKFYRGLVLVAGFCVGAASGNTLAELTSSQISESGNYPIIMSLVGGAAFGAMAIPYLRTGLFFITGGIGAYAMFIAAQSLAPGYSLAFAVAGFLICGSISMLFFQLMVVVGTSLLGGVATVCGGLYFIRKYSPASYDQLLERPILLPATAIALAMIGVGIQMRLMPEDGLHPPGQEPDAANRKQPEAPAAKPPKS